MKRRFTWLLLLLPVITACAAGDASQGETVSELLRPGRSAPLLIAHRGELRRIAAMGVDAMFTDDVQAAAQALGRSR